MSDDRETKTVTGRVTVVAPSEGVDDPHSVDQDCDGSPVDAGKMPGRERGALPVDLFQKRCEPTLADEE